MRFAMTAATLCSLVHVPRCTNTSPVAADAFGSNFSQPAQECCLGDVPEVANALPSGSWLYFAGGSSGWATFKPAVPVQGYPNCGRYGSKFLDVWQAPNGWSAARINFHVRNGKTTDTYHPGLVAALEHFCWVPPPPSSPARSPSPCVRGLRGGSFCVTLPGVCQADFVSCYVAPTSCIDSAHSIWSWSNDKKVVQRGQIPPLAVPGDLSSCTSPGRAWQLWAA